MANVLSSVRVKSGEKFEVRALRREGDELSFFAQYLSGLDEPQRKKILGAISFAADYGPPRNREKSKKLHGPDARGLFELKEKPSRIIYFYGGPGLIVMTHGFDKRGDDTPLAEIEKALKLREEYLSSGNERARWTAGKGW